MDPKTEPIKKQIGLLREELSELEAEFLDFERMAQNSTGSKKYRSIARRIVLSAQRLEQYVKENTFSYP